MRDLLPFLLIVLSFTGAFSVPPAKSAHYCEKNGPWLYVNGEDSFFLKHSWRLFESIAASHDIELLFGSCGRSGGIKQIKYRVKAPHNNYGDLIDAYHQQIVAQLAALTLQVDNFRVNFLQGGGGSGSGPYRVVDVPAGIQLKSFTLAFSGDKMNGLLVVDSIVDKGIARSLTITLYEFNPDGNKRIPVRRRPLENLPPNNIDTRFAQIR